MIDLFKENKTLRQLILGVVLYGLFIEILLLIFTKNIFYNSLGLIVGVVASIGCAIHMAYGIDIIVSLDEKSAIAYTRKQTVIRYAALCVILIAVGVIDFASPVTLIFGFLGLKAGAYLNPIINKFGGKEKE